MTFCATVRSNTIAFSFTCHICYFWSCLHSTGLFSEAVKPIGISSCHKFAGNYAPGWLFTCCSWGFAWKELLVWGRSDRSCFMVMTRYCKALRPRQSVGLLLASPLWAKLFSTWTIAGIFTGHLRFLFAYETVSVSGQITSVKRSTLTIGGVFIFLKVLLFYM